MVMERCNRSFGDFKTCRRKNPMKVAEALRNVISNARDEGRLVTGITQMANILKSYTHSDVMMCIVEIKSVENMQMKLLEAFCTEHNIKVLKVDDYRKLLNIDKERVDIRTASSDTKYDRESQSSASEQTTKDCGCNQELDCCSVIGDCTENEETDATCLLLTKSAYFTEEEEFVLSFYDTFRNFVSDQYPILKMEAPVL